MQNFVEKERGDGRLENEIMLHMNVMQYYAFIGCSLRQSDLHSIFITWSDRFLSGLVEACQHFFLN